MQPDDLKTTWKQFKASNALESLSVSEVLSAIDTHESRSTTQPYRQLVNVVLFLVITLFCIGG